MAVGGGERGLSNRFPVSTAQSLRHHSIVCFTTQFFRHCLAARMPPLCRFCCADDSPNEEGNLPGFEISVDIVALSSPQHPSVPLISFSSDLFSLCLPSLSRLQPSVSRPHPVFASIAECLSHHPIAVFSLAQAPLPILIAPIASPRTTCQSSALYILPNMSSRGMLFSLSRWIPYRNHAIDFFHSAQSLTLPSYSGIYPRPASPRPPVANTKGKTFLGSSHPSSPR
jgi:hypothetical protein